MRDIFHESSGKIVFHEMHTSTCKRREKQIRSKYQCYLMFRIKEVNSKNTKFDNNSLMASVSFHKNLTNMRRAAKYRVKKLYIIKKYNK